MARFGFWVWSILFQVLFTLLQGDVFATLFFIPFALIMCHYRLNNIGMSGWWVFSLFIPLVNLYPSFMLSFAPTGFKRESHENYNKPDGVYYIGLSLALVLLLLVIWFVVAALFNQ